MYSSHITRDLARAHISDQIARAQAHRLATAARPARSPRRRTAIPAAARALLSRFLTRPAT